MLAESLFSQLWMASWSCMSNIKHKDGGLWQWNLPHKQWVQNTNRLQTFWTIPLINFFCGVEIPAAHCCPLLGFGTCLQPGIHRLGQPALSAQRQVAQRGGGESLWAKKQTPDSITLCPKVKSRKRERDRWGSEGSIMVLCQCPASFTSHSSHKEESLSFCQVPPDNINANTYKQTP